MKLLDGMLEGKLDDILGGRTAADNEKPAKNKKEKPVKVEEKVSAEVTPPTPSEEEINPFAIFSSPEESFKVHTNFFISDGSLLRPCNSKSILEKNLRFTRLKVMTTFPPEPNGYFHIGQWSC